MSPNPPRSRQLPGPSARVHSDGLADDEAIGYKFADGLAGIGVGDLVDFVRVEPDLAFPAADDRGGEPLLGAKVDPVGGRGGLAEDDSRKGGVIEGFG